jgi:hypothetical protein
MFELAAVKYLWSFPVVNLMLSVQLTYWQFISVGLPPYQLYLHLVSIQVVIFKSSYVTDEVIGKKKNYNLCRWIEIFILQFNDFKIISKFKH